MVYKSIRILEGDTYAPTNGGPYRPRDFMPAETMVVVCKEPDGPEKKIDDDISSKALPELNTLFCDVP